MPVHEWALGTFAARREQVLEALGGSHTGGAPESAPGGRAAMVLPAAPQVMVGRDLELRYAVDPDLWYLTGYPEPEAVAVLHPAGDAPFTLFVRDRDADRELWTGPRIDVEEAGERYGADAVHPIGELGERLPGLLKDVDRVFFRLGSGRDLVERAVLDVLRGGRAGRQRSGRGPAALLDPGLILDEMRLIKEPAEVDAIRDAVRVTMDAFREGLAAAGPGVGEWVVEAAVEQAFRRAGADGPAFATIAASGANATVLHYIRNDRVMGDGDLLLLDAGARHRIYNGDLTRTVPVSGAFRGAQADLHRVVRDANRAAIQAVRPGATIDAVHSASVEVLVQGLVEFGLLADDPVEIVARHGRGGEPGSGDPPWKRWFPHRTSHWLGLDVHDVGTYARGGEPRALEPGMVLTVEPGLYIPPDADEAPAHLRGLGVRIEDDVLVTRDGHEVLSADLPSDPDELRG